MPRSLKRVLRLKLDSGQTIHPSSLVVVKAAQEAVATALRWQLWPLP